MDIKWSYYLIAAIYALVIVLRLINHSQIGVFKKQHPNNKKTFSIKKDFFTTVSLICILVTIFINGAALLGGKPMNINSIVVTVLVCGFTVINSFSNIIFSSESKEVCLLGYTLSADEIENLKIKEKSNRIVLDMTFVKEIDSYNYAKITVYGKHREELKTLITKLKKEA